MGDSDKPKKEKRAYRKKNTVVPFNPPLQPTPPVLQQYAVPSGFYMQPQQSSSSAAALAHQHQQQLQLQQLPPPGKMEWAQMQLLQRQQQQQQPVAMAALQQQPPACIQSQQNDHYQHSAAFVNGSMPPPLAQQQQMSGNPPSAYMQRSSSTSSISSQNGHPPPSPVPSNHHIPSPVYGNQHGGGNMVPPPQSPVRQPRQPRRNGMQQDANGVIINQQPLPSMHFMPGVAGPSCINPAMQQHLRSPSRARIDTTMGNGFQQGGGDRNIMGASGILQQDNNGVQNIHHRPPSASRACIASTSTNGGQQQQQREDADIIYLPNGADGMQQQGMHGRHQSLPSLSLPHRQMMGAAGPSAGEPIMHQQRHQSQSPSRPCIASTSANGGHYQQGGGNNAPPMSPRAGPSGLSGMQQGCYPHSPASTPAQSPMQSRRNSIVNDGMYPPPQSPSVSMSAPSPFPSSSSAQQQTGGNDLPPPSPGPSRVNGGMHPSPSHHSSMNSMPSSPYVLPSLSFDSQPSTSDGRQSRVDRFIMANPLVSSTGGNSMPMLSPHLSSPSHSRAPSMDRGVSQPSTSSAFDFDENVVFKIPQLPPPTPTSASAEVEVFMREPGQVQPGKLRKKKPPSSPAPVPMQLPQVQRHQHAMSPPGSPAVPVQQVQYSPQAPSPAAPTVYGNTVPILPDSPLMHLVPMPSPPASVPTVSQSTVPLSPQAASPTVASTSAQGSPPAVPQVVPSPPQAVQQEQEEDEAEPAPPPPVRFPAFHAREVRMLERNPYVITEGDYVRANAARVSAKQRNHPYGGWKEKGSIRSRNVPSTSSSFVAPTPPRMMPLQKRWAEKRARDEAVKRAEEAAAKAMAEFNEAKADSRCVVRGCPSRLSDFPPPCNGHPQEERCNHEAPLFALRSLSSMRLIDAKGQIDDSFLALIIELVISPAVLTQWASISSSAELFSILHDAQVCTRHFHPTSAALQFCFPVLGLGKEKHEIEILALKYHMEFALPTLWSTNEVNDVQPYLPFLPRWWPHPAVPRPVYPGKINQGDELKALLSDLKGKQIAFNSDGLRIRDERVRRADIPSRAAIPSDVDGEKRYNAYLALRQCSANGGRHAGMETEEERASRLVREKELAEPRQELRAALNEEVIETTRTLPPPPPPTLKDGEEEKEEIVYLQGALTLYTHGDEPAQSQIPRKPRKQFKKREEVILTLPLPALLYNQEWHDELRRKMMYGKCLEEFMMVLAYKRKHAPFCHFWWCANAMEMIEEVPSITATLIRLAMKPMKKKRENIILNPLPLLAYNSHWLRLRRQIARAIENAYPPHPIVLCVAQWHQPSSFLNQEQRQEYKKEKEELRKAEERKRMEEELERKKKEQEEEERLEAEKRRQEMEMEKAERNRIKRELRKAEKKMQQKEERRVIFVKQWAKKKNEKKTQVDKKRRIDLLDVMRQDLKQRKEEKEREEKERQRKEEEENSKEEQRRKLMEEEERRRKEEEENERIEKEKLERKKKEKEELDRKKKELEEKEREITANEERKRKEEEDTRRREEAEEKLGKMEIGSNRNEQVATEYPISSNHSLTPRRLSDEPPTPPHLQTGMDPNATRREEEKAGSETPSSPSSLPAASRPSSREAYLPVHHEPVAKRPSIENITEELETDEVDSKEQPITKSASSFGTFSYSPLVHSSIPPTQPLTVAVLTTPSTLFGQSSSQSFFPNTSSDLLSISTSKGVPEPIDALSNGNGEKKDEDTKKPSTTPPSDSTPRDDSDDDDEDGDDEGRGGGGERGRADGGKQPIDAPVNAVEAVEEGIDGREEEVAEPSVPVFRTAYPGEDRTWNPVDEFSSDMSQSTSSIPVPLPVSQSAVTASGVDGTVEENEGVTSSVNRSVIYDEWEEEIDDDLIQLSSTLPPIQPPLLDRAEVEDNNGENDEEVEAAEPVAVASSSSSLPEERPASGLVPYSDDEEEEEEKKEEPSTVAIPIEEEEVKEDEKNAEDPDHSSQHIDWNLEEKTHASSSSTPSVPTGMEDGEEVPIEYRNITPVPPPEEIHERENEAVRPASPAGSDNERREMDNGDDEGEGREEEEIDLDIRSRSPSPAKENKHRPVAPENSPAPSEEKDNEEEEAPSTVLTPIVMEEKVEEKKEDEEEVASTSNACALDLKSQEDPDSVGNEGKKEESDQPIFPADSTEGEVKEEKEIERSAEIESLDEDASLTIIYPSIPVYTPLLITEHKEAEPSSSIAPSEEAKDKEDKKRKRKPKKNKKHSLTNNVTTPYISTLLNKKGRVDPPASSPNTVIGNGENEDAMAMALSLFTRSSTSPFIPTEEEHPEPPLPSAPADNEEEKECEEKEEASSSATPIVEGTKTEEEDQDNDSQPSSSSSLTPPSNALEGTPSRKVKKTANSDGSPSSNRNAKFKRGADGLYHCRSKGCSFSDTESKKVNCHHLNKHKKKRGSRKEKESKENEKKEKRRRTKKRNADRNEEAEEPLPLPTDHQEFEEGPPVLSPSTTPQTASTARARMPSLSSSAPPIPSSSSSRPMWDPLEFQAEDWIARIQWRGDRPARCLICPTFLRKAQMGEHVMGHPRELRWLVNKAILEDPGFVPRPRPMGVEEADHPSSLVAPPPAEEEEPVVNGSVLPTEEETTKEVKEEEKEQDETTPFSNSPSSGRLSSPIVAAASKRSSNKRSSKNNKKKEDEDDKPKKLYKCKRCLAMFPEKTVGGHAKSCLKRHGENTERQPVEQPRRTGRKRRRESIDEEQHAAISTPPSPTPLDVPPPPSPTPFPIPPPPSYTYPTTPEEWHSMLEQRKDGKLMCPVCKRLFRPDVLVGHLAFHATHHAKELREKVEKRIKSLQYWWGKVAWREDGEGTCPVCFRILVPAKMATCLKNHVKKDREETDKRIALRAEAEDWRVSQTFVRAEEVEEEGRDAMEKQSTSQSTPHRRARVKQSTAGLHLHSIEHQPGPSDSHRVSRRSQPPLEEEPLAPIAPPVSSSIDPPSIPTAQAPPQQPPPSRRAKSHLSVRRALPPLSAAPTMQDEPSTSAVPPPSDQIRPSASLSQAEHFAQESLRLTRLLQSSPFVLQSHSPQLTPLVAPLESSQPSSGQRSQSLLSRRRYNQQPVLSDAAPISSVHPEAVMAQLLMHASTEETEPSLPSSRRGRSGRAPRINPVPSTLLEEPTPLPSAPPTPIISLVPDPYRLADPSSFRRGRSARTPRALPPAPLEDQPSISSIAPSPLSLPSSSTQPRRRSMEDGGEEREEDKRGRGRPSKKIAVEVEGKRKRGRPPGASGDERRIVMALMPDGNDRDEEREDREGSMEREEKANDVALARKLQKEEDKLASMRVTRARKKKEGGEDEDDPPSKKDRR